MSFLTASTRRLAAAAAIAASAGLAGTAFAGNNTTFELTVAGGAPQLFDFAGTELNNGVFNYQNTVDNIVDGYTVSWNINSKGFDQPFISGNLVVVNNSDHAKTFTFRATVPISPALLPFSLMGGSVAGGLTTDLDGGFLRSLPETPVWQAFIDGKVVATLLDDFFEVSNLSAGSVAFGPEAFGQPIPSMPGPAVQGTMEILISFELSAGDQASFTSVFTAIAIPAPAAFAFFGLAGLAGGRGRRRN